MTSAGKSEKRKAGWGRQAALLALPLLFLAIFFYLPLLTTFRMAWVSAREPAFSTADLATIWRSLSFTFYQATLSTALTLLVGLPAAYLFSRYLFRGKRLLRALVMVPFILPTVVVAAGFNALLGPRGWLNLALMSLFNLSTPPIDLIYTLAAILLAHLFYNTSVIIRLVGSAWSRLDIQLEQAGRVLGAGRLQVFRKITLPLLKPVILSASLLVFLFDFTSFGVILLLGRAKICDGRGEYLPAVDAIPQFSPRGSSFGDPACLHVYPDHPGLAPYRADSHPHRPRAQGGGHGASAEQA